ncbi:amidase domain-containing protein [Agromyces larvae]|uniref:Amidase domain-containing protein n=1 Tax=Agromyces larvae TaxID=2929802 RepID=A0ABY4BZV5_9MICO|nr:amidase domain-containing protein [Agromyces larvae]UOE43697.1 amidase domain-containing protein [Agromyces larvae]
MQPEITTPARHRSTYRPPADLPIDRDLAPEPIESDAVAASERSIDEARLDEPGIAAAADAAADAAAAAAADRASIGADAATGSDGRDGATATRVHGRHRADRRGNRRAAASGLVRRLSAATAAAALLSVSVLGVAASDRGAVAVAEADEVAPEASGDVVDTLAAPAAEPEEPPAITGSLSTTQAPFTGGTEVSVDGEHLDEVASVTVGGVPATIVAADDHHLTFAVPATAPTALGTVEVALADDEGEPVGIEVPSAPATVGTPTVIENAAAPAAVFTSAAASGATGTSTATGAATATATSTPSTAKTKSKTAAKTATTTIVPAALTLTYTSDPRIDAQANYVLTYWHDYNRGQFMVIEGYDCANFTSQSLLQRGWQMDGSWWYDFATGASSPTWTSSTAMRDWLYTRPDLATPLDDSQRAAVKVGDIAQFDWDNSGDRDHTAVVTRVEHTDAGTKVWVGGHTKDADYWDVDTALATGGGSVSYFSLR